MKRFHILKDIVDKTVKTMQQQQETYVFKT